VDGWYFTHAGLTLGPIPTARLNELIAAGHLGRDEAVWPEGVDVQITVQVYSNLLRGVPGPDWLADVQKAATAKSPDRGASRSPAPDWLKAPDPSARPTTPGSAPDWLADVKQLATPAAVPRPAPKAAAIPPDWLEDICQIEETVRGKAPLFPKAAPSSAPPPAPAAPLPAPSLAHALDARADSQAVSVYETFLKARGFLEQWVNAAQNERHIRQGDFNAVRNAPQVEALLRAYDRYGPVMQAKLRNHLDALLENRRKQLAGVKS
jgi:hypothetical protein